MLIGMFNSTSSAIFEAEDIATEIKSVPVTQKAKESLIWRLNLEGHQHLLNLKQVTTAEIADAWLCANRTRDWTILVEALLTEPGLGHAVSGVLPLSKKVVWIHDVELPRMIQLRKCSFCNTHLV